jgi:hypothetical protein
LDLIKQTVRGGYSPQEGRNKMKTDNKTNIKKQIKKTCEAIVYPFQAYIILLEGSRSENLDGAWNDYWAKKNMRAELRELKTGYIAARKSTVDKWQNALKKA